jgi:hypothetical protein
MGQIREGVGYFWKCVGWFLVVIIPGGGGQGNYMSPAVKNCPAPEVRTKKAGYLMFSGGPGKHLN